MKVSYDSRCTTSIPARIEKHKWLFIRSSPVSNDGVSNTDAEKSISAVRSEHFMVRGLR